MKRMWKIIVLTTLLIFTSAIGVHAETTIKFGKYPQTRVDKETELEKTLYKKKKSDSNIVEYKGEKYIITNAGIFRYEPISWIQISGNSSRMLLISEYVLDNRSFGKINHMCVSWDNSDLRNWCNTDFMENAFTSAEQKCIYLTDVSSCDWGKEDSMHTSEKVTLPSDELIKSLSESVKMGIGTDYSGTGPHNYYTRCTGSYYKVWNYPIWVTSKGKYNSSSPANWGRGIRPCIVLNLSAAETVEKQQGETNEKEKTTYKLTYKLNGGTNNKKNPKSYTFFTKTFSFLNPIRKGYIFKGWYADSRLKKPIKKIAKGSTGNKTIYAKWEAITYSIEFDGNGVYNEKMARMSSLKYGQCYKLKKNLFKAPTGKQFKGWNTKKDGSGKEYKDQETVADLTSKNGTSVRLYAQWEKKVYTIKYKIPKGENNSIKNPAGYTGDKKITLYSPSSPIGKTFTGWYNKAEGGKKVSKISKGTTGNMTLYARYKANTYTVEFNGNNIVNSVPQNIVCVYGKEYKISSDTKVKWKMNVNGQETIFVAGQSFSNLTPENGAVVTLYALPELKLTCREFISNDFHATYIDNQIARYLNDIRVKNTLDTGYSVIFMFEGGSDNYPSCAYQLGKRTARNQAVVIVVQNRNNDYQIVYQNENCSTLPDNPNNTSIIPYESSTTIYDGMYYAYRTIHSGYAALNVRDMNESGNFNGFYISTDYPNGISAGCNGINIHTRTSYTSGSNKAWSEGCQLVGSTDSFKEFMSVFSGNNSKVGIYIVDRQLAKKGLVSLYGNESAVEMLTAGSK